MQLDSLKSVSYKILQSKMTEFVSLSTLLIAVFIWKSLYIARRINPIWDGAVYLLNAHDILLKQSLYEWFRPLLFSGIVAAVWSVTGESYLFVRYFNLAFTIATAAVLYYLARRELGRPFAIAAALMYITSIEVLIWSDHLLVHGLTSLFSILALLAFRKYAPIRWSLGGAFAALAVLARYTSIIIVMPIALAFVLDLKRQTAPGRAKLLIAAALGAGVPLLLYQLAFPFVLPNLLVIWFAFGEGTGVPRPWYYYLLNWGRIFGIMSVLGLAVLVLPSTYKAISSRPWAFWLLGSIVFFAITLNKQDRFTFEWTPAVAYLSILGLRKIYGAINLRVSMMHFPSTLSSSQIRRILVGTMLPSLLLIQVVASVAVYVPVQQYFANDEAENVVMVAQYMSQHMQPNSRFLSDIEAPNLSYFSGRMGAGFFENATDPGFLGYLHKLIVSNKASYVITFPNITENSPSVLMQSGFLELNSTMQVPALGQVYFFTYIG